MNTTFLSSLTLEPSTIRLIEIDRNELKLTYENDAEVELEFADEQQLDRFVSHLLVSLVNRETAEEIRWN